MAAPNASDDQIKYLLTYFDEVHAAFKDQAQLGVLSEGRADVILLNLQSVMQNIQATGFEQLRVRPDRSAR
ncbi:Uncharacterised protein [Mycobacteroides abscessus subsp. massiliense]|uniref:Uncharacterized protein n=1 Tax=Mycobacteroides abscessus subsp. massiliense TaxID=1962118 RepID=A0A1T8VC10_9MYCO|nr:hypothetical protein [Mycobacteroides abscessus]SKN02624.1 Uncharacterised protein [Mycobacteroides abscessus subsp. massiliense]SKX47344.1 Uncharacterised protein [Mycobacteroides abscessus subsp. massiliense]